MASCQKLLMRPMLVTVVTVTLALHNCVGFTKGPANYHIQTDEGNERFFKYQTLNGQFRKEKRLEDGSQVGTYGWVDPTGLLRLYDYVADDWGYRIVNSYTENLSQGQAPYSAPGAYAPSTGYNSENSVEMDMKDVKTHATSPGKTMYAEKASNVYAPPPATQYGPPSSKEQEGHHHHEQKDSYSVPKKSESSYSVPEKVPAVPVKYVAPVNEQKHHHQHSEPKNTYRVPAKTPETSYSVPSAQEAHVETPTASYGAPPAAPRDNYGPPKETYNPPVSKNTYSPPKASYIPPVKDTYVPPAKNTYTSPKVSYSVPPQDTYVAPKQSYSPPPPKETYSVPVKATYVPPKKQTHPAPPKVTYSAPAHKKDDDDHHHAPAISYSVPAVKASKPVASYEAPKATYGAPIKAAYKAPTPSYHAPVVTSYSAPKKSYVAVRKRPYDPKPAYTKSKSVAVVYKAPADDYKPVSSYSGSKSYTSRNHYSAPAKVTSYKPRPKAASHHHVNSYSKAQHHHHHDDHHQSASYYTPASYKVVSIVKPGSGYGDSSRKVIGFEDPHAASYHGKAHVHHKAASSHHHHQPPTYSHHQKHTVSYSVPEPKVESYSHVSYSKGHVEHHHDDDQEVKNSYVPPQQDTKAHHHHHKEKAGLFAPPQQDTKAHHHHHKEKAGFFSPPKAHHNDHHGQTKGHVEHDDHHEVQNTYIPPGQDAKALHHDHNAKAGFFAPPKAHNSEHHSHHHKEKAGFFAPPTARSHHESKGGFFSPAARPYKAAHPTTQTPYSSSSSHHHHPTTPSHYSRGVLTPVKAENKVHHHQHHHKKEDRPLEIPVTSYRPTQKPSSISSSQAHPEIRFHGNEHGSTVSFHSTPQPPHESGVFFAQVLPQQNHPSADSQAKHSSGEVTSILTPPSQNAASDHFQRFADDETHDPELDKIITKFTPHRFETADRNVAAHFVAEDHEHATRSRSFIPPATHLTPASFSHRRKKRDVRLHKNFHEDKVPNRETTVFVPPRATQDIHHAHTFSPVPKQVQLAYATPTEHPRSHHGQGHHQSQHHHQAEQAPVSYIQSQQPAHPPVSHDAHYNNQGHQQSQHHHQVEHAPVSHNTHHSQAYHQSQHPNQGILAQHSVSHNTHHQNQGYHQSQLQKPYHPAAAAFRAHKKHYLAQHNSHQTAKDPNVLLGVYDHGADANFRYNTGNQFHYEKTLPNGQRQGKYGYVDPFGIFRAIHYSTSPHDGGLHIKKDFRFVGKQYDTSYE